MILEDAVTSLMIPVAATVAILATVLMLVHVARRYRTSPKHVPLGLGIDGRPRRLAPKAMLWLAPIAIAVLGTVGGVLMLADPGRDDHRAITVLVFVILAEIAAFIAWITDRQIELARKQTFRIAPSRLLLVLFPLLATATVLAVIAIRASV